MDHYPAPSSHNKESHWINAEDFLKMCCLEQYISTFIKEGFESFEAIREITEEDLIALEVKRGHRRVIQRNIATLSGVPRNHPLIMTNLTNIHSINTILNEMASNMYSTSGYESMTSMDRKNSFITENIASTDNKRISPGVNSLETEMRSCSFSSNDEADSSQPSLIHKRKYKRHPKLDKNAPTKPCSAYIMFSNTVRAEFKDKNMSFVELAKIVGDRWKTLNPVEKRKYELNAMKGKDEYTKMIKEYQKTDDYKTYQSYLSDFKMKQDSINKKITRSRRRAKLERADSESVGDASSNGSSNSRTDVRSSSSGSIDIYQMHYNENNDPVENNDPDNRKVPSPPVFQPRTDATNTSISNTPCSVQIRESPIPIHKIISEK